MQQEGRGDVICQNPGYATGSTEASDHLRNTFAPYFDQAPLEIVQIQETFPGLRHSYYLRRSSGIFRDYSLPLTYTFLRRSTFRVLLSRGTFSDRSYEGQTLLKTSG